MDSSVSSGGEKMEIASAGCLTDVRGGRDFFRVKERLGGWMDDSDRMSWDERFKVALVSI